jgi:hypothetical protein
LHRTELGKKHDTHGQVKAESLLNLAAPCFFEFCVLPDTFFIVGRILAFLSSLMA